MHMHRLLMWLRKNIVVQSGERSASLSEGIRLGPKYAYQQTFSYDGNIWKSTRTAPIYGGVSAKEIR